jgi:hypothetical protein
MIALARPEAPARPVRRRFRPGQFVELDWPANFHHGARGRVELVDGDQIGVTWWIHGDGIYVVQPADRLMIVEGGSS